MTGAAPKLRVTPAEFAHCPNPDWAAMTALVERFGDAMTEMAMGLHPVPPEMFDPDVTEIELVAAMVRQLHFHVDVAVPGGTAVDPLAFAMMCACIWNRQADAGVRRG